MNNQILHFVHFFFLFMHQINHMLPKLFENKKNLTILSQRDLAKVPPNITSIERTPSLHINPSPITDPKPITNHLSQTHHRSPIHQPINNQSTDQTHQPNKPINIDQKSNFAPSTTKPSHHQANHHNIGHQPPRKTHKKTTTDLAVVDLEIHQPWQQSHHANR